MERWLDPLLSSAEMRATDARAIDEGVPSLELMERAGSGLARIVAERYPDGQILIVCGKGNNGGDGFVAARHLRSWGHDVAVVLVAEPDQLAGDALINFERLLDVASGFSEDEFSRAVCIVDALLGTGVSGAPREPIATAIEQINKSGLPVVSVDIPSGVDADSGEIELAVEAALTVTFHVPKVGLSVWPGKQHAGEVVVLDIGIPKSAERDASAGVITESVFDRVPRRSRRSSKFSAGRVAVVGGSVGLTGAPSLAAMAAARSGSGYVTALVPASLNSIFEQRLLEPMTKPLQDQDGHLTTEAIDTALGTLEQVDAAVIGPGLGRDKQTGAFVRGCIERLGKDDHLPVVLDADGLNAFAGAIDHLKSLGSRAVLTPHDGELARLLDTESSAVSRQRLKHARLAAEKSGATVILKGDDTLVVDAQGQIAVSVGNCPGLATAGTGDVLSGIIASLLARGMDPFIASCAAVQLHLMAGKEAELSVGREGMLASDVIDRLPGVLSRSKPE